MHKPAIQPPLLAVSLVSLGLAACGDPPPAPDEVRARITSDLGHVLSESSAAQQGAAPAIPGLGAISILEGALGQSDMASTGTAMRRLGAAFAPADPVEEEAGGFDPDAIVAELNESIFTDENHIGDGVYVIPSELVCMQTTIDQNGIETQMLDAECAEKWADLELRIRVESDGAELRFNFQVGAGHDEPLVLALTHTSLAVTIDLDAAEAATATIAAAFGESAPNARLAGRVTGKLEVLGASHVAASLTVNRALEIAVADDGIALDGPDATRFATAVGQLARIELDGTAGVGDLALGLGETALHIPGEDQTDLDLPGMTLAASIAGNQLSLTNVSLGDRTTTMKKHGVTALAIDLNPDAGRSFDATLIGDETTGISTLEVSPKLDIRIAIDHAVLGELAPIYDVTRVELTGGLRSNDASDQVEVLGGALAVTTSPAQYGFTAASGQCVSSGEAQDVSTGDFYTTWSVGACL